MNIVLALAGILVTSNANNILVRIWDNLEIFDDQGASQGSWNMTAFPYIENVSVKTC